MIYLVVGHRGVGKSKFLKRIESYYKNANLKCQCIDLDDEITHNERRTINEIFVDSGEDHFRQLEQQTLSKLLEKFSEHEGAVFIALGAGYQGDLPAYVKVLWLRRPTDRHGRIFLDRPRLEAQLTPIDEYRSRYMARVARFRNWNTKQITMEEGWQDANEFENKILGLLPSNLQGTITVLPEIFQNEMRLEDFITDKIQLGVRFFELRDDLLTPDQMDRFYNEVPRDKLLFGFRTRDSGKQAKDAWWFNCQYDWALELGDCPWGVPKVLSLHYRDQHEGIRDAIDRLMQVTADHYKLAVPTDNLVELWAGHAWMMEDPEKRSFLPMSQDGKWWWYRALRGSDQFINFLSDGEGSSFDQPTLFQWLMVEKNKSKEFAAVLGNPITHSRTPAEQFEYFDAKKMPVVSIQLSEDDCTELGFGILQRLGLVACAITAPFKNTVASFCDSVVGIAKDLKAVNTMQWDKKRRGWIGANTDVAGLEKVLTSLALPKNIVVWGGGGTKSTLMRLLPEANFFRARSGEELFGQKLKRPPELIIWAVGRERQADCVWPDISWKPLMVLDLNYTEDSPGREYAQRVNAKYISGIDMFKSQAESQREFWTEYGEGRTQSELPI